MINKHLGLYTDYYELSMAQGYFKLGRSNERATFDYFFRDNPFDGGYVIFAGLEDLLSALQYFQYSEEDLKYLKNHGFEDDFLDYLKSFQFRGTIDSVPEGEVVFPGEPILQVSGNLIEVQLIETIVLNILNFQSLIATKASRIRSVAGNKTFIDFGLRRAQGFGGIHASKAAIIGGADATSNVYSGYQYNIGISGTQAHSWIQSFPDEYTAFEKYAEVAPGKIILLVDTYDTLHSGIPNAIKLAKQLEKEGKTLDGIRLDSGDLYYFSKKARKMLDDAGFKEVKIIASNQLDEYVIKSLNEQGAPIDGFGVGTHLVTGHESPALDGIYKLAVINGYSKLKISEDKEKVSLPGCKKIFRLFDNEGYFYADAIALEEENENHIETIYHPVYPEKNTSVHSFQKELITHRAMENGTIMYDQGSVNERKAYAKSRLQQLPIEHKRFINPHIYKVGITLSLLQLKENIIQAIKKQA